MRRFVANPTNHHPQGHFVHIVEDSVISYTQHPDRFLVFPWRLEARDDLPFASLSGRFIEQLFIDLVQNPLAVESPQPGQIQSHAFGVHDVVHN